MKRGINSSEASLGSDQSALSGQSEVGQNFFITGPFSTRLLCPPSMKWWYIALQMLVGLSVGQSVVRLYLVQMITRHRTDLALSNLAQSCVSGCR